jgi:hypothetical protein
MIRVFENRALKIIFGPERDEIASGWRNIMWRFIICTLYLNIIRVIK